MGGGGECGNGNPKKGPQDFMGTFMWNYTEIDYPLTYIDYPSGLSPISKLPEQNKYMQHKIKSTPKHIQVLQLLHVKAQALHTSLLTPCPLACQVKRGLELFRRWSGM